MKVKTSREIFRSPLVPAAAVLYSLTALLGSAEVALLFDRRYAALLAQDLVLSGIIDPSSVMTWTVINTGITLVCFLCPCVLAVCLWVSLAGHPVRGNLALSTAAQWLLYAVNTGGITALVIFVFRFVRYIVLNISTPQGVYAIFAMILMEGLMAAQAVFLFNMLRKFLNSAMDSAAGIASALASDKPEDCFMSGFTATGLLILGFLCIVLCIDRIFTLTIVPNHIQDYYAILTAEHPGMWLSGLNLLTGAIANFLLCLYLRRCKRDAERCAFYKSRLTRQV